MFITPFEVCNSAFMIGSSLKLEWKKCEQRVSQLSPIPSMAEA